MPGWDQILVYLIVAAAALYLARQFLGKRKRGCDTGGCSGCPATSAGETKSELVQLEMRPRDRA